MARPKTERSDLGNVVALFAESQAARFRVMDVFANQLRSPQVLEQVRRDDHLFATVLKLAFDEYGVRQSDIMERLDLSAGVLSRWAKMTNLPTPLARASVVMAISDVIHEGIARQKSMNPDLLSGRVLN